MEDNCIRLVKSFQKFNRFARICLDSVKLSCLKLPKCVKDGLMRPNGAGKHRGRVRLTRSQTLKVKVGIQRELGGSKRLRNSLLLLYLGRNRRLGCFQKNIRDCCQRPGAGIPGSGAELRLTDKIMRHPGPPGAQII